VAREPGPRIRFSESWRERLIRWVLRDVAVRAGVFIDESWFVLWPHQAESWAEVGRPLRIPKSKSWGRDERPPSRALYAEMDVRGREVRAEWHETWNQEETWRHLEGVIKRYEQRGVRYLVVFWDHGPWHTASSVRRKVRAHNLEVKRQRRAGNEGGVRVLLFYLPIRSPWLMPLEGVFGQTKRAIGTGQHETMAELQAAVERRLEHRNTRPIKHPQLPKAS
jgi:DDE superfamily endonuclease